MTIQEVFSLSVYHGYIFQILVSEALFLKQFQRRNYFWLRILLGLPIFVFLAIVLPNIVAHFVSGFFSLIIFLLSLALCVFLFKNRFTHILFYCISAQFVQNLSYHIENMIYLPLQDHFSQLGWFFFSLGNMAVVYTICFFVYIYRMKPLEKIKINTGYVVTMAVVTAAFIYVIQYLFMYYNLSQIWLTHLPMALCCIFALYIQNGFVNYRNAQEENRELEYFLHQERKQYEMTKENIAVLNMKAHDLKHHINRFQNLTGYDKEEIQDISKVVEEYETMVDCGNKEMNIILTKIQYECQREKIAFTSMVEGSKMGFLRTPDMISIYSNVLDNAFEAEKRIVEKGKRFISINVHSHGSFLITHVENYCNLPLHFEEGLPVTTKEDKDFHGLGLKSVRYVVSKYQGNINIFQKDNLFVVDILLPMNRQQQNLKEKQQ